MMRQHFEICYLPTHHETKFYLSLSGVGMAEEIIQRAGNVCTSFGYTYLKHFLILPHAKDCSRAVGLIVFVLCIILLTQAVG